MKVHAVVVNWNGGEANLHCLESLQRNGLNADQIHFIDNASQDGSLESALARHPGLRVRQTGANVGFAAAANLGISAALQAGAAAVWLVNNDSVVLDGCLEALTSAAVRQPEYGLYGPRIYADHKAGVLWCCGVRLGWGPNLGTLRGHLQSAAGRFERSEVVPALTGCGLLILRSVIERIGPLSERYFVYVEDADYCARARGAGFQPFYVADALMEHAGAGSTGGGYGAARKYLTAHGTVLYLREHGTAAQWLSWLFCDLLLWPVVFLCAVPRGRAGGAAAKWRGTWHALIGRRADAGVVSRRA